MNDLKWLYEQEQNFQVSCFWDAGYTFKLGDEVNGWRGALTHEDFEEGARQLVNLYKDLRRCG